jgi:hypothetical protein
MKLTLTFNDNTTTTLGRNKLNLYRSLHPYPATHDGLEWPARPDDFPMPAHEKIDPNLGSFDVYSRYFTLPNSSADGGKIRISAQQWFSILKKNNFSTDFEKWSVGQNNISTRIMRWEDGYEYPVFHYPLCFGGNFYNVLEQYGNFSRVETWPMGTDVPDDLPDYLWLRCWSIYDSVTDPIRDAPAGPGHIAMPCWMLALAHSNSAWIYNAGLLKI